MTKTHVLANALALCLAQPYSHAQTLITPLQLRMAYEWTAPAPMADASSPATLRAEDLLRSAIQAAPSAAGCTLAEFDTTSVLSLERALEWMLCRSPNMRQALAAVNEQTAGLRLADLAWRPQVNLSAERASNRIPISNNGSSALSESLTGSVGLSWVLFDFGARSAGLEQARLSLASALAAQDANTLASLRDALKIYVEAAGARAKLDVQEQALRLAAQSAGAARAKYAAQVASLSEKLQAETALAQATLERVRAQGNWRSAAAALAVAMGLRANTELLLPAPETAFAEWTDDSLDAADMERIRNEHPRIRALRADAQALAARLDAVRADGRGSLSLSGSLAATRALGVGNGGFDRSVNTSLLATIPLFNGAQQAARELQVQSQISAREALVQAAERELDIALAQAVVQLQIEQENQTASRAFLSTAQQGFEVALGRYKAGVGSVIELLTAQAALSTGQAQWQQAKIARANAQIGLALTAGRLGPSSQRR